MTSSCGLTNVLGLLVELRGALYAADYPVDHQSIVKGYLEGFPFYRKRCRWKMEEMHRPQEKGTELSCFLQSTALPKAPRVHQLKNLLNFYGDMKSP